MARGIEAKQRRFERRQHLRSTRGIGEAVLELVPVAVKLTGIQNRGGELRRGVEERGGASEERSGAREV